MKLSKFIQQLQKIESDINHYAHPSISDSLSFYIETEENILNLDLESIEWDQSMGCRCTLGASIKLKPNSKKLQDLLESQPFDIEL